MNVLLSFWSPDSSGRRILGVVGHSPLPRCFVATLLQHDKNVSWQASEASVAIPPSLPLPKGRPWRHSRRERDFPHPSMVILAQARIQRGRGGGLYPPCHCERAKRAWQSHLLSLWPKGDPGSQPGRGIFPIPLLSFSRRRESRGRGGLITQN